MLKRQIFGYAKLAIMFPKFLQSDPDHAWVELAQSGNVGAIKALYEKYFKPIYRFLFWQTGDELIAEDLTQETFLGMVRGLTKFQGRALFRNWLYQIAKYQLVAWIKLKSLEAESFWLEDQAISEADSLIDPEDQLAKIRKISRLLKFLPLIQKRVLELRFLRAYSVKEVAEKLKLSQSNVKILTLRGLAKLRTKSNL